MLSLENVMKSSIGEYLRGAHCSEVIFKDVTKAWNHNFDESLVRVATPFGGGIAERGDACGALVGALMVIGYLFGRSSLYESQSFCLELSRKFYDGFKNQFSATTCYGIRGHIFTWETHVECAETVRQSINLLWELLNYAQETGQLEWQR